MSSALSVPDPTLNTTRDFQYLPVELFEKALKWLWSALETKQTGWLSSGGCFRSSSPAAARRGPPLVWPVRQPPPTGVLSLVFREFVFSSTRPWFWYQSNTCTSLLSFPLLFDPFKEPILVLLLGAELCQRHGVLQQWIPCSGRNPDEDAEVSSRLLLFCSLAVKTSSL